MLTRQYVRSSRGNYLQAADEEFPREGVGCWHPVFPARADDISMMAAVGVKYLESIVVTYPTEPTLTVFEQQFENGVFTGMRHVTPGATYV